MNGDDTGMPDLREEAAFLDHRRCGVKRGIGMQNLEGDFALEPRVPRAEHGAVGAGSHRAANLQRPPAFDPLARQHAEPGERPQLQDDLLVFLGLGARFGLRPVDIAAVSDSFRKQRQGFGGRHPVECGDDTAATRATSRRSDHHFREPAEGAGHHHAGGVRVE